jgi:hypothetical protein
MQETRRQSVFKGCRTVAIVAFCCNPIITCSVPLIRPGYRYGDASELVFCLTAAVLALVILVSNYALSKARRISVVDLILGLVVWLVVVMVLLMGSTATSIHT